MTSKPLVLLTGATGFLGHLVLLDLLRNGYPVRAAVRSAAKADKLRAAPALAALGPSPAQLSFITVPDMTVPDAYVEAVRGVTYIIHCASPIPALGDSAPLAPADYEAELVAPARIGVERMLEAALAAPGGTVRRVVVTSSTVAPIHFSYLVGQGKDVESRVVSPDDRTPDPAPPYAFDFQAYSAGKTAALNATDAFARAHPDAAFNTISILPSWIFGRDELATDVAGMLGGGTNAELLAVLRGNQGEAPYTANAVKATDVARAHVAALGPEVQGNQSFVLNTPIVWEDAIGIAKGYRPEAFADGRLREDGKQPGIPLKWDVSKSEKILGIKFASFDTMVKEVTDQYLELLAKE